MGTSRRRCSRSAIAGLAIALLGTTASAAPNQLVGVDEVRFEWAAASGNPTSYMVSVSRNRAGWKIHDIVTQRGVDIPVSAGDTLSVSVRALGLDPSGAAVLGPASPPSDEIEILAAPQLAVGGEWTLFCPSCRTVAIRSLADASALDEAPTPAPPWTLVARVSLVPGREQLVWQHASTGAISLWDAYSLTALSGATAAAPPGAVVVGAADVDRDGTGELVLHDPARGRVEFWGIRDGRLQRRAAMSGLPGATLGACADLDGDGAADLVWATETAVRLWRIGSRSVGGALTIGLLSDAPILSLDRRAGHAVAGVADYDGRVGQDLLLRDASGNLTTVSFFNGQPLRIRALPVASGDARRRVVGSLDLDDDSGAEIVLQHLDTGEIQSTSPQKPTLPRITLLHPGPAWRAVDVRR